ncbi:MAG TPA: sialidase family protein [Candidatus Hydrogenedentes bacterium]|nr:sialidase family protein [Candidatus Hydrogenedentota bacterium]
MIKKREMEVDGFNWLHGLALVWHKNMLFSFWGHNKKDENTPTEVAQGRHSLDGGVTWSPVWMLADHTETEGRSHGVFLSHDGKLWAFLGRFGAGYADLRTEAFLLMTEPISQEDVSLAWESTGIAAQGFWPCDRPIRMNDGNWIMAGARIPDGPKHAYPAVAISRGNDFSHWDTVALPVPDRFREIWGETTILVESEEIVAIVRGGWDHDTALVSTSRDFGRRWTELQRSNLPMPCTKAFAGHLSTGQRYVVGTFVRDHGRARHPLTLAVSKPGENLFSQLYRIRDDIFPQGPGESIVGTALSYPYAVEHEGHLYVAYSNDGGRGRNLNSAEMAVIPIASLVGNHK